MPPIALLPALDSVVETAAWLARVPMRAGWARRRWWPQFLTRAVPYRKSEGTKHEARYNFDVLSLLGVPEPATLEPPLRPRSGGARPPGSPSLGRRRGGAAPAAPQLHLGGP